MQYRFGFLIILILGFLTFASTVLAQATSLGTTTEIHSVETTGTDVAMSASGGEGETSGGLGSELPLWSVIPFIGILLSIAIFPLVAPDFWHHHFGKISAFWGLLFAVPFLFAYKGEAIHAILHTYFLEYIPFIILLWALFTVAGGI